MQQQWFVAEPAWLTAAALISVILMLFVFNTGSKRFFLLATGLLGAASCLAGVLL